MVGVIFKASNGKTLCFPYNLKTFPFNLPSLTSCFYVSSFFYLSGECIQKSLGWWTIYWWHMLLQNFAILSWKVAFKFISLLAIWRANSVRVNWFWNGVERGIRGRGLSEVYVPMGHHSIQSGEGSALVTRENWQFPSRQQVRFGGREQYVRCRQA